LGNSEKHLQSRRKGAILIQLEGEGWAAQIPKDLCPMEYLFKKNVTKTCGRKEARPPSSEKIPAEGSEKLP